MSDPINLVLDTNNLVSSQINKKGASFLVFNYLKTGKINIYTSPFQLKEFERVLFYPRIRGKYCLNTKRIKKIVKLIKRLCIVVYPIQIPKDIKSDPDDNHILAIAQEAQVDYIISGDRHLLELKKWRKIPIITAKKFLQDL
jgi:putative PIN family toxin of toxin-antitoxin system